MSEPEVLYYEVGVSSHVCYCILYRSGRNGDTLISVVKVINHVSLILVFWNITVGNYASRSNHFICSPPCYVYHVISVPISFSLEIKCFDP